MIRVFFLLALVVRAAVAAGLDDVLAPGAAAEKIAGNFKFIEGPAWSRDGFLIFSDIPANLLYCWLPDGAVNIFRTPSGHANGNAFDRAGRLISCLHDRRVVRTSAEGNIETLAERFEGKRFNSPNDLAIKSDGSIYFTDPPFGLSKPDARELDFCGVYRIGADGVVTLLTKDLAKPNGIAFSPDEKRLYVADCERREIIAFDVQADGALAGRALFAEVKDAQKPGVPDGLRVDAQGRVWCAGPGGVWVFEADGKLLGALATPEEPANLEFGGADRKTLFITARTSLYRIPTKVSGR